MRISIDTAEPLNQINKSVSPSRQAFNRADELVASFAKRFLLERQFDGQCEVSNSVSEQDICISYSRFKDEGIMLSVRYSARKRNTTLVLVKEARAFGTYTKTQVLNDFTRTVLMPLNSEFGDRYISVQQ